MNYKRQTLKPVELTTWTSTEIRKYLEEGNRLALIPIGSFEQHGPHAPMGTDTFIGMEICNRLARKLCGVVIPPIGYGVSSEHTDFAGTITISPLTLCNLVNDVVMSLMASGFTKIVIINGHRSNERHLRVLGNKINAKIDRGTRLLIFSYWDKLPETKRIKLYSPKWGLHANEYETSIISAILPNIVKKLKNIKNFPAISQDDFHNIDEETFRGIIKDSNGVWGDPERASIQKGKLWLSAVELTLTNYLLKALDLPESERSGT